MTAQQLELNFEQVRETPQQLLSADELYDALNEDSLHLWKEDSRFEKKPVRIQPTALGDYFSMWANTPPDGGLIVVGISKDNVFEGCLRVGVNKINDLEKTGKIHCPDALYSVKRVNLTLAKSSIDDFVLAFHVHYVPRRVVRTSAGKVFVRRGDSKFELRTAEENTSIAGGQRRG